MPNAKRFGQSLGIHAGIGLVGSGVPNGVKELVGGFVKLIRAGGKMRASGELIQPTINNITPLRLIEVWVRKLV